jgi:hypothetical protein
MSLLQSGSKRNRRYVRQSVKGRAAGDISGVSIHEPLREAIEVERDNLSRAESILGCLAIAMEYGSDAADGEPYYPDVARLARELVKKSINGLDSLSLQERLGRHGIKEGCRLSGGELVCASTLQLAFMRGDEIGRAPKRGVAYAARTLRLHRRHYGRVLSRNAASADSASANICG